MTIKALVFDAYGKNADAERYFDVGSELAAGVRSGRTSLFSLLPLARDTAFIERMTGFVLTFLGPSENGKVDLVETAGVRSIVKPFREAGQLLERMDELAQAWRAKARERRYTQAFRERHYDFLRRYVELKTKIERAITDGPG